MYSQPAKAAPASTRRYQLSSEERAAWERDGFFVRANVFTAEENSVLNRVVEDIVAGERPYLSEHVDRNALVRDGMAQRTGIHAMHKLNAPSCYLPEFLHRVRDPRLTDPIMDLLGPDLLGINNLYIWKAPEIGLGFPWHQDKFFFGRRFATDTTVGTWTAFDAADEGNGCLYVIPGSHRFGIAEHDEVEGSQQREFRLARNARNEDGIALQVDPGAVIWFHSHLLHKSTDNRSGRFRRCYVAHYLSAQAEWANPDRAGKGPSIMWIRGDTFPGKVTEVQRELLPV